MAVGILGVMGVVPAMDGHLLVGKLSLDGAIRPVRGALSVASCAQKHGIENLVLPADNAAEAAVVEGVRVYGVRHLAEVVALVTKPLEFSPVAPPAPLAPLDDAAAPDFRDVRGQATAERLIEVAAAGGHNILTLCPPAAKRDQKQSC